MVITCTASWPASAGRAASASGRLGEVGAQRAQHDGGVAGALLERAQEVAEEALEVGEPVGAEEARGLDRLGEKQPRAALDEAVGGVLAEGAAGGGEGAAAAEQRGGQPADAVEAGDRGRQRADRGASHRAGQLARAPRAPRLPRRAAS